MGFFTASTKDKLKGINEINEFPLFVGECTSGNKIIQSKLIFNEVQSLTPARAIKALIEVAKEAGYDAITHIHIYSTAGAAGSGVYSYGNMVKFG